MSSTLITSVRGFAKHIVEDLDLKDLDRNSFSYSFSVADYHEGMKYSDIADQYENNGVYGIHTQDMGFDSYSLFVVGDYYGGGSFSFVELEFEMDKSEMEREVELFLARVLALEGVHPDSILIIKLED